MIKKRKMDLEKETISYADFAENSRFSRLVFLVAFSFAVLLFSFSLISSLGCCFNPSNGQCLRNSEEVSCTSFEGEFLGDPSCSDSRCEKGCCVLGEETEYSTVRECELNSRTRNFELNFQLGLDEASCTSLGAAEEKGACLFPSDYEKPCKFTTYSGCSSGDFKPGMLCTAPELKTLCKKTPATMLVEDKDEIYYRDSCGNPANIYDSSKYDDDNYWRYIVAKNNSCGFSVNNAGSKTCGNCNYKLGSIAGKADILLKPSSGNYICKDLNCKENNGTARKNGESWCKGPDDGEIYVGTRYFRQYCLNSQIFTEPCADFRMETCNQNEAGEAKCVINLGTECTLANLETVDLNTGSKVDIGACDLKYCYIFDGARAHCVSFSDGGAFCTKGDDTTKWYKSVVEGDSFTMSGGSNEVPLSKGDMENYVAEGGVYGGKSDAMMKELHLEMCVPKIPAGMEFWSSINKAGSSSSKSAGSACSAGDYQGELKFESYERIWWLNVGDGIYGLAGLLANPAGGWRDLGDDNLITDEGDGGGKYSGHHDWQTGKPCFGFCDHWVKTKDGYVDSSSIPANPVIISILDARCAAIGDCDGKANWVEVGGSGSSFAPSNIPGASSSGISKTFSFSYTCSAWKAPASASCERCGKDGLACSEYRCRALGRECEYKSQSDSCVSSNDLSAPAITLKSRNPAIDPVQPYTPVEFVISTSEMAECKFNFDNAGGKYSEMKYDFGKGYALEHNIILTLPGQTKNLIEDSLAYSLVKEGKHTIYVRCLDSRGNGEIMKPFEIGFEIMKTPDTISPKIMNFSPASGSSIKYNTSSKLVSLTINEPSECKWDYSDKNFSTMIHNFSCDESITEKTILSGASCSGLLTGITTNITGQTKFYIRCKDQPWLEDNETGLYKRNENDVSREYILRPSQELKINELTPVGDIIKSREDRNVIARVITSGGALNGLSKCYWKSSNNSLSLADDAFTLFNNTNSRTHSQLLTSPFLGENFVSVRCLDSSENVVYMNSSFKLSIDSSAPVITRAYEESGLLKLKTNEDSLCYYNNIEEIGCSFSYENATRFAGAEKEHTASWVDDSLYFIKCKDYRGNEDITCGKIFRTY